MRLFPTAAIAIISNACSPDIYHSSDHSYCKIQSNRERERDIYIPRTKAAALVPPWLLGLEGLPLQSTVVFMMPSSADSPFGIGILLILPPSSILVVVLSYSLANAEFEGNWSAIYRQCLAYHHLQLACVTILEKL